MAERNWKTFTLFLESIGFKPMIDVKRDFIHYYNSNTEKELTFEKHNLYSKLESEMMLEVIDVEYNNYRVFLSSLDNTIQP